MSKKETIDKAYGHIPKEVVSMPLFDVVPFRGIRYYWILLKRKFR